MGESKERFKEKYKRAPHGSSAVRNIMVVLSQEYDGAKLAVIMAILEPLLINAENLKVAL